MNIIAILPVACIKKDDQSLHLNISKLVEISRLAILAFFLYLPNCNDVALRNRDVRRVRVNKKT